MSDKACPKCGLYLTADSHQCKCGFSFRDHSNSDWGRGFFQLTAPSTLTAWTAIILICPLTIGLFALLHRIDWFHLSKVSKSLVGLGFILLPLICHIMPTVRKKSGGGCFGFVLWLSMCSGIFVASELWSFDDPVRTREHKAIPRLNFNKPISVSGIQLGQSVADVEQILGKGKFLSFPYSPNTKGYSLTWDDGTLITFANDSVVKIEGRTLSQEGKTLLKSGDSLRNIKHIFDTSSYAYQKRSYKVDQNRVVFRANDGKYTIRSVIIHSLNTRLIQSPSPYSIDGIPLGQNKREFESAKTEEQSLSLGKTKIDFNKFDRVESVTGEVLAFDGKVVLKRGDQSSLLRATVKKQPKWPLTFITATFSEDQSKIESVTLRRPSESHN